MRLRTVLVPVKRVVDYAVKIRIKPDQTGVETANVKLSTNPFDDIATEEAIRLMEKKQATQVVALSVGPPSSLESVRGALSLGATRGIHIQTTPEQSQLLDPLNVAKLIQRVILEKEKETDLVILGKQSIDGDNNQTGQILAGLLNWPQGTFASSLAFPESPSGKINVTREVDGGMETVQLSLPAVITADLRLNEPRYATLPNIMNAKKKPLLTLTPKDLGLEFTQHFQVLKVQEPPGRAGGVKLDSVEALYKTLKEKGFAS